VRQRRKARKPPPHVARPTAGRGLDAEDFPKEIEGLASDVVTFLNCLNEFPEFTDEAVNTSIKSFEDDLKVCRFTP
jgi:WD repeat-containing protein 26